MCYRLFFFCFALDELAKLRTQRNPMYDRGWFWYSQVRQAARMNDSGSFHEPPRTLFFFSRYGSSLAALYSSCGFRSFMASTPASV